MIKPPLLYRKRKARMIKNLPRFWVNYAIVIAVILAFVSNEPEISALKGVLK
jgi:hypothetical protein